MTLAHIDSSITDFAQNLHFSVPVDISALVYSNTLKWQECKPNIHT